MGRLPGACTKALYKIPRLCYTVQAVGRQFETILSLNKTRDENRISLFWNFVGTYLGKVRPFLCLEVTKMDMKMNRTHKLALSGMVMAIYIVVMYLTQSFAFLQYQVRIATAIYALAYLFPFLVLPLGLSNLLSNLLMGSLGVLDVVGGGIVGVLTALCCALIRRFKLSEWLLIVPVTLIPALGVPAYLSGLLHIPYWALVSSLLVGQFISGLVGMLLVKALKRGFLREN